MTRLKFLAFAAIALGLWVAHLVVLSPLIAARASDGAVGQVAGAAPAIALELETQRSYLQGALLKAATTPAVILPVPRGAKPDAPSADRVNALRATVQDGVPDALREDLIVGIVNDTGALFAVGTKDPAPPPDGFDSHTAGASAGKGEVLEWGGPTLFQSIPLFYTTGTEVKTQGSIVVGFPLAADGNKLTERVAKQLGLSAVGVVVGGKISASAGAQKAQLPAALKSLKAGQSAAVDSGSITALGPIKLPILTGGPPALEIGARTELPNTPYEVIALASTRTQLEALAGYQKSALAMLFGLLIIAIGFAAMAGGRVEHDDDDFEPVQKKQQVPPPPALDVKRREEPLPSLLANSPPPAEAHPDDFNFGPASGSSSTVSASPGSMPLNGGTSGLAGSNGVGEGAIQNPYGASPTAELQEVRDSAPPPVESTTDEEEPAPGATTAQVPSYRPPPPVSYDGNAGNDGEEDPFAQLMGPSSTSHTAQTTPGVRASALVNASRNDASDFDDMRTVAYPAHKVPADPFSLADQGNLQPLDDSPDATRVATIPQELINASARTNSGESYAVPNPRIAQPLPSVRPVAPPVAVSAEETHFMEVFRDFVSTRDRCGEPADGLTYEKFAAKLRKNKEQLVAKYNCKTVRFQVYVKDGKAALKATPVKD